MRLKVSPNEALRIVDDLVDFGQTRKGRIENEYYLLRAQSEYDPHKHNQEYIKTYQDWFDDALIDLRNVFEDITPIEMFKNPKVMVSLERSGVNVTFSQVISSFQSRLNVLYGFYENFSSLVRSPLIYLPEKAKIYFFGIECALKLETNESEICRYMFGYPIGEFREYAEIYAHFKGDNIDTQPKWPKEWKKVVDSAYKEINRKTNASFGFPILQKEKYLLAVALPPKFIANLR